MAKVSESERLVDRILRLRRAGRVPSVALDVAPVRADLEEQLGPTLSRSRAARILGVSQTALDRWVAKGQVPTVVAPDGRAEVPRRFVIEVAEQIGELKRRGERGRLLAAALRRRREEGEQVRNSVAVSRPSARGQRSRPQAHLTAERRGLAYHRVVAERLDEQLVTEARRRIDALGEQGKIHPRYAEQWREVLSRPILEIAEAIASEGEEGRALRQSSPFAGVLNEQERRAIIETVR